MRFCPVCGQEVAEKASWACAVCDAFGDSEDALTERPEIADLVENFLEILCQYRGSCRMEMLAEARVKELPESTLRLGHNSVRDIQQQMVQLFVEIVNRRVEQ